MEYLPCRACGYRSPKRLCARCYEAAATALDEMPAYYTRLGAVLAPGARLQGRVTGSKQPPLPVRVGVLSLRAPGGIVRVLSRHEDDWRSVLGWTHRPFRGSVERTVAGCTQFLSVNLTWAADSHPAPEVFVADVKDLATVCRGELEKKGDARPIGVCPAEVESGRCEAVLWADPFAMEIRCWACRTAWPREKWLMLAAAMG